MKIFNLFLFVLIFSSCQYKDSSIGISDSENYKLNNNIKDSLLIRWNSMLKTNNINTTIKSISIIKDKDITNGEFFFTILGLTKGDSAKVAVEIIKKNEKFYFLNDIQSTVICNGSTLCNPKKKNGNWLCDNGSNTNSCSSNCEKITVSSVSQ